MPLLHSTYTVSYFPTMFFKQCFTDGAADVSGSEDQAIVPLAILGVHQVSVDPQILRPLNFSITGILCLSLTLCAPGFWMQHYWLNQERKIKRTLRKMIFIEASSAIRGS